MIDALHPFVTDVQRLQWLALALGVGLALALFGWLSARRRLQAEGAQREAAVLRAVTAETRLTAAEARLEEVGDERDSVADDLREAMAEAAAAQRDLALARAGAEADAASAAREIAALTAVREGMTAEFKALAAETLRAQGADTTRLQSEALASLLTPFREQVHRFQTELQTRETAAGQERAALDAQIRMMHARSEEIGRDAVALTRALKGDRQKQGAWGEMILTRLLEDSGLEAGRHFTVHETRHDDAGRRLHPDVVVRLPGGRRIVVDSKVSLLAYERAASAEDEAERAQALKAHVASLRAHVTGLSGKDYAGLDPDSVDYVVMFVPIESAYADAMRADPDLWRHAQERQVIVAPPMNLLALLRTVEHVWSVERREANAAEIAAQAGKLYDKVAGFVGNLEDVGKHIGKAAEAQQAALNQLRYGRGNVIGQVERLKALGARTGKSIALDHDAEEAPLALTHAREE